MAAMWNSTDTAPQISEAERHGLKKPPRVETRASRIHAELPKCTPPPQPRRAYSMRRVFSLAVASE